jgi:hypothetical protein
VQATIKVLLLVNYDIERLKSAQKGDLIYMDGHLWAEWSVAFGTLVLAGITVWISFKDDSYTKMRKAEASYNFKKKSFNFLEKSLSSWGPNDQSLEGNDLTVQDFINNYRQDLLKINFSLGKKDYSKFESYASLAQAHADSWSKSNNERPEAIQKRIILELQKLCDSIGNKKQMEEIKKAFPHLFGEN